MSPPTPESEPQQTPEINAAEPPPTASGSSQAPISGKRQAFDDVLVPLTPKDLADPGTQKLILHMLQQARTDADQAEGYILRFYDADKRAAILQEKLDSSNKISKTTEIAVMTGTTLGGALIGMASYFWAKSQPDLGAGVFVLVIGVFLLGGAIAVKMRQ